MSDELRKAAEKYVAWQYRMPGAPRFTLTDLRAALDARPDSPTPVIIGTRGHGKPDHCSEHGDIDRVTSMATHKATMHPGVTFYDAEVPGYGTAWSSARPDSPTLDVERLARGISAGLTLRLIAGNTDQTYAPSEVAVMVKEVIDQQVARLTAEAPERPARDPRHRAEVLDDVPTGWCECGKPAGHPA